MRAETIRIIFLNYATLYQQYGHKEDYQQMCWYYRMLLNAIKNQLKHTL